MNGNNQFFIFSAELQKNSNLENMDQTNMVHAFFISNKIPYKTVEGRYKGINEVSFVVDAKHENDVRQLSFNAGQESVLFVDSKRNATLYYTEGKFEKLGKFVEVDGLEANLSIGFTHDTETDKYYIIK